ncbi:hypothetical protein ABK040_011201 [Willaertia magna]
MKIVPLDDSDGDQTITIPHITQVVSNNANNTMNATNIAQQQQYITDELFVNKESKVKKKYFSKELYDHKVLLEWRNIEYTVKVKPNVPQDYNTIQSLLFELKSIFKTEDRKILHSQSGSVAPGEILAIMGASGGGKTSLLNVLSQRTKASNGQVLVNGMPVNNKFFSLSSFVQQDDVLMGNLTVRETLRYAALLTLPSSMSLKEKMERVDNVMKDLNLIKAADTIVGEPGITKGISGGERKRLSIAIELLTEPSVLFLDEPTTGCDSKTSLNIIRTLVALAKKGNAIVLTIHQPRADIFQMFDKLLLLSRGRIAYYGKANEAYNYFSNLGYMCPEDFSIADYVIDLVSENPSLNSSEKAKRQENLRIESVLNSYQHKKEIIDLDGYDQSLKGFSKFKNNWISQFFVLFLRSLLDLIRDTQLTFTKLIQYISMALMVGLVFIRLEYAQSDVQNRIGVLFFILLNAFIGSGFSSLSFLEKLRPTILRERASRVYPVSSMYFAQFFVEVPAHFIYSILFGSIAYFLVNLNPSVDRFLMFLLILIVNGFTGQSFGNLLSYVTPSFQVASSIFPIITTVLMLFGGFYKSLGTLPSYSVWLYWISPYHYGFEALILNEFKGRVFECPPLPSKCFYPTGDFVIENLEMNNVFSNVWIDIAMMLAVSLGCRIISFAAFVLFVKQKQAA